MYEAFAFCDLVFMQCPELVSQEKFMSASSLCSQERSWKLVH